jgi:tripartite-type tricarboxylate transporter receptor subunit TctC
MSYAVRKCTSGSRACIHLCAWIACVLALAAVSAVAQNFPARPIRVVTTEAGSSNDFVGRLLAPGLTASLGQQVIIDNRGGAILSGRIAAEAQPDGHTVILYGSPLWLLPFMQDSVPYDPIKSFSPIALTHRSPNILVVHPTVAVNSVKELIALAKSKPRELNYGSGTSGSSTQLAAELFKAMAGVDIVRVPYKGTGPALIGLLGGQVQVMFPNAPAVTPHIKSGKLRALAVTSSVPSPLVPGLPTIAASGLPGYESVSPFGMLAPANTPVPVIRKLNQEVVRQLAAPEVMEKLLSSGAEPGSGTPEQFAAIIKAEMARLGKLIRDVGIRDK